MSILQPLLGFIDRYRIGIVSIICIYVTAMIGQWFLGWTSTHAEQPLAHTNLVAIVVHESLTEPLRDDLNRYAQTYIPSHMDNALPLLITYYDNYTPKDLTHILANLFAEGIVDKPSTLKGVVLVGDIPLPTVYDQDHTYQTIFPYVDFKKTAYRRNENTQRFEGESTTLTDPKPELRHGLMTRGNTSSPYVHFFAKLRRYYDNPSTWVGDRIRIDDFSDLRTSYDSSKLPYYLQKNIYAEDLNYHRYTPLLLSLLQHTHNKRIGDVLSGASSLPATPTVGDESDEFVNALNAYTTMLNSTLSTQSNITPSTSPIPTKLLQNMIKELTLPYPKLLSSQYRNHIQEATEASGRWTMDHVDSHGEKIFNMDSVIQGSTHTAGLITRVNNQLETLITQTIKERGYATPYPLLQRIKQGGKSTIPLVSGCGSQVWEAMYYGLNGINVQNIDDIRLYRGTYGNHKSLSNTMINENPLSSVGASYGINNVQTQSNRGYNTMDVTDADIIGSYRDIDKRCKNISPESFINVYRGGNTLLNLNGETLDLKKHSPQHAWQPIEGYNGSIGGSIVDIAGSRRTTSPIPHTQSHKLATTPSIQQTKFFNTKFLGLIGNNDSVPYCSDTRRSRDTNRKHQLIDTRRTRAHITINGQSYGTYNECKNSSRSYDYRLIDSIVTNQSPLPSELSGMNITTIDRPIDSDHSVSFQGLTNGSVTFTMPNIRDTEVFSTTSGGDNPQVALLDVDDIANNIRTLLRNHIRTYNTLLTTENTGSRDHYERHRQMYDFLKNINPQATVDRSYELFDEEMLVQALGSDTISSLAQGLWRHNLPRSKGNRSTIIQDDIASITRSANIDHKINYVMDHYIQENATNYLPGYYKPGYESIVLHSNTNDTLQTQEKPTWPLVNTIHNRRTRKAKNTSQTPTDVRATRDAEICGYSPGSPVMLVGPWLKAFNCWLEQTTQKPFDISLTRPDDIDNSTDNWTNFTTSRDTYRAQRSKTDEIYTSVSRIKARESQQNTQNLDNAPNDVRKTLRNIYYNTSIERSTPSLSIDKINNASIALSTPTVGTGYTVSLSTTGANCPLRGSYNLCDSPVVIDTSHFGGSGTIPLSFDTLYVGDVLAQLTICHTNSQSCVNRSTVMSLTPGKLTHASIIAPTNTIAHGALLPLTIHTFDAGYNRITTLTQPLNLSAGSGSFVSGPTSYSSVDIHKPFDQVVRFQGHSKHDTPRRLTRTITLTQPESLSSELQTLDTHTMISVPSSTDITLTHPKISSTDNFSVSLSDVWSGKQLSNPPKLRITLRDTEGSGISNHHISIHTNHVYAHFEDATGQHITSATTDKDGTLEVAIVPHNIIGTSTITIQIYGQDIIQQASIKWTEGLPHTAQLIIPHERIRPGESMTGSVSVTDFWGNPLNNIPTTIATRGPLTINNTTQTTLTSNQPFSLRGTDLGVGAVLAVIDGIPLATQLPDANTITIADELVSLRSLNTLTAYLDGQGRGDRTSPTGKNRLREAFLTSSKLLGMSTTLMPVKAIGTGNYHAPRSRDSLPGKDIRSPFVDDMTALTDRAEGAGRGASHLPYSNPLTVVYGDPFLVHDGKNPSDTIHTTTRGERIATLPGKTIRNVHSFDFNNDTLNDLLVEYRDGSLHLLKNYGGSTDPYVDMGLLMVIDDRIEDIQLGDADGNGYDDIIVRSNKGMRIYPNTSGVIDVDGFPVCLPLPGGVDAYDTIHQFFMRDMDQDGSLDIIINDTHGTVRIVYGGSSGYISRDRFVCDDDRSSRVTPQSLVVARMAIELDSGSIRDDSLIHRKGLSYDPSNVSGPSNTITQQPLATNGGTINQSSLNDFLLQNTSQDIDAVINNSIHESSRYIASPFRFVPNYYPSNTTYRDIYYMYAYSQGSTNPVTIEKTYTDTNGGYLLPGDEVTVVVTARADRDSVITYFDSGRGARELDTYTSLDNPHILGPVIKSMDRSGLDGNYVYKGQPGGGDYLYMIDNLSFAKDQTRQRSYTMRYRSAPLIDIDIRDENNDQYDDIVVFPDNACQSVRRERLNTPEKSHRSYTGHVTDLSKTIQTYTNKKQEENNTNTSSITDSISTAITGRDPSQLDMIKSIGEQRGEDFFDDGKIRASLDLDLAVDPAIQQAYSKITQDLCQGFTIGKGCGGLPVPFNMAFLAPGDLQVMGCKIFDDKGLPAFFFPGTLYTPVGPIPIPYGQTGPGDSFYRAKGGQYPSMIRVYAAPTLTQQVGVAVCLGPMGAATKLPSPLKHISGNCIVTALPLQKSCPTDTSVRPDGDESLTKDWADIGRIGSCSSRMIQATKHLPASRRPLVSPIKQAIRDPLTTYKDSDSGTQQGPLLPAGGSLGGVIVLDQSPSFINSDTKPSADTITLQTGKDTKNKIVGGNGGGLAQCLIDGWLDPQITYIANNLTTLDMTIYLPNLNHITRGLGPTGIPNTPQKTTPTNTRTQQDESIQLDKESLDVVEKNLTITNPFDRVREAFEEVSLINITTQKVPITIPMLTSENLIAYETHINERITYHKSLLKDLTNLINASVGVCGKVAGLDMGSGVTGSISTKKTEIIQALREQIALGGPKSKQASSCLSLMVDGKIHRMIVMEQDMTQVMQKLQENIQSINTYKQFPQDVAQLIRDVDAYVVDVADFVTTFFGTVNNRLSTNARIFNGYVDAIISIKVAVTTRQRLVDLSDDRKQSCSTCSNDNYGAYSCSLKFMCPSLPVLKIPPMKIPDIYIDISHIDASVDIVLPELSFVPKPIELPKLPQLPQLPTVDVGWTLSDTISLGVDLGEWQAQLPDIPSIPDIPVIPPAPTLPSLPQIIPDLSLELPYLPPPPDIPELSPSIQSMITVGENIGKLFCIMKEEIGLVGEKGVKSKIEQLTQRTWNVPIFDYFDLTHKYDSPTLEGLDFRLSSYVDFTMNMDGVFDVINGIAQKSNSVVDHLTNRLHINMKQAGSDAQQSLDKIMPDDVRIEGYRRSTDRNDLRTAINLVQSAQGTQDSELTALLNTIDSYSTKSAQYNTQSTSQDLDVLLGELATYRTQLASINQHISNNNLLAVATNRQSIYIQDRHMLASLDLTGYEDLSHINPMRDYLNKQHDIITHYRHVLDTHDADSLHLGQRTYNDVRHRVDQTYATLNGVLDTHHNQKSSPHTASLVAQTTISSGKSSSHYDFGSYLGGTYRSSGDVSYDVIASDLHEQSFLGSKQVDINNDTIEDVIVRDTNSIYIKYANNNTDHIPHTRHGHEGDVIFVDLDKKIDTPNNQGSITIDGVTLRIWHEKFAPQGLETNGQSYDTITLNRDNTGVYGYSPDAYLIHMNQRADTHHDQAHQSSIPRDAGDRYVLVLPQGSVTPDAIKLNNDYNFESTESLIERGILTVSYNPFQGDRLSLTIGDLPRYRHYARITHMQAIDNNTTTRLKPSSPRSSQTVAGPQITADHDGPTPTVTLQRDRLNYQTVSTGATLHGYVGTHYTLHTQWADPSGITLSSTQYDNTLHPHTGASGSLSGLFFDEVGSHNFTISATDSQGNTTTRAVILHIESPTIDIIDVQHNNTTGVIVGELSHDIDEGSVSFGSYSYGEFVPFDTGYNTSHTQTIITGGSYTIGDTISLYNTNNNNIGTLDPHTGRIRTVSDRYTIRGQRYTHQLRWHIIDNTTQESLFSIHLPINETIHGDIIHPGYTSQTLDTAYYSSCITQHNSCIIARDESGNLIIPAPYQYDYHANYRYNDNNQTVTTTIIHSPTNEVVGYTTSQTINLLSP